MAISGIANQIALNNILFLTDFSPASEIALPWVSAIAGDHHSKVFVAHVLLPDPYVCMAPECADVVNDGQARAAKASMDHIEGQLKELPHQAFLLRGPEIWTALQPVIQKKILTCWYWVRGAGLVFKSCC